MRWLRLPFKTPPPRLPKAEGRPVRDHPVISRLVELRSYLEKVRVRELGLLPSGGACARPRAIPYGRACVCGGL